MGITDKLALKRLHKRVSSWFEPELLKRRVGLGDSVVERIALDWFAKDGKRWRPFLAVAVFAAVADIDAEEELARDMAIALEAIHKASLIYDDIQDADALRYGESTVHEVHGVPVALTASLLLIGHGYRMLASCSADAEQRAAMLELATRGHCDLCLGQGAELVWMRDKKPLTPEEVLEFFRWKTAPSFDVVLRLPCIAGRLDAAVLERLADYCLTIGTAYQIADDLDDYHGGGDVDDLAMGRPDIVVAYAFEAATDEQRTLLRQAWCGDPLTADLPAAKRLLVELRAEERARATLADHRRRAGEALEGLDHPPLQRLLRQVDELLFDKR